MSFGQDLRYAARTLTNSRGFTLVAVLTLAIGVGANVAIFSFVDGILLKPLPYDQPERIVRILEKPPQGERNGISWTGRETTRSSTPIPRRPAAT